MKNFLICIFVLCLLGVVGCGNDLMNNEKNNKDKEPNIDSTNYDIRELAYNQLTEDERNTIKGSWEDSRLSKITLKDGMGNIYDDTNIGKEVYLVDFTTTSFSIPNNIIVYISMDNYELLGYGLVD